MTLKIDATRALRTHDELLQLVKAIRDASVSEPETDAVESKSTWDLTDAAKRFETARHVLGFGNRTVAAAAREFEGCAYFVGAARERDQAAQREQQAFQMGELVARTQRLAGQSRGCATRSTRSASATVALATAGG